MRKIKNKYNKSFNYIDFHDEIKILLRTLKENHKLNVYINEFVSCNIYNIYDLIKHLQLFYKLSYDSIGLNRINFFLTSIINYHKRSLSTQMMFYRLNTMTYLNVKLLNELNHITYNMQNNIFKKIYFNFKNSIKYA